MLGTKLRAIYQRKRARELFDLSEALSRLGSLDPRKVVACFTCYAEHDGQAVSRAQFEANLAEKLTSDVFLNDVQRLISTGVSYDPVAAVELVGTGLFSRLPAEPWKGSGA